MSAQLAEPCTVSGNVTTQLGEPLSAAKVTLRGTMRTMTGYTVITGLDGSFALKDVAPGDYWANASCDGYAPTKFGRRLNLAPGQVLDHCDLTLKLGSSVAGTLTDPRGEPASGILVALLQEDGQGGVFAVSSPEEPPGQHIGASGKFQFDGLEPGTYFLMTHWMGFIPVIQEDPMETIVPTFYPGVADFREARPIHVAEGARLTDFTFSLRTSYPHRVRGRIDVPDDGGRHTTYIDVSPPEVDAMALTPPSKRVTYCFARSRMFHSSYRYSSSGMDPAEEKRVRRSLQPGMPRRAPDDTFDIWVLPGSYRLVASLVENGESEPNFMDAYEELHPPYLNDTDAAYKSEISLELTDQDVNGLSISFVGMARVDGLVRFEQHWHGSIPARTQVFLQPVGANVPAPPTSVPSNGEVTFKYLSPGRYTVKVRIDSEDLAVQSVRYNGTEIAGAEIEVQPAVTSNLEVTAVFDLGQIDGVVETADGSSKSGALVWLFKESRLDQPFRQLITDPLGRFEIPNLPPGEYRVQAVTQRNHHERVRHREHVTGEGSAVTVTPNGHATVSVKISPGPRGN